jgi:hypothetical protein
VGVERANEVGKNKKMATARVQHADAARLLAVISDESVRRTPLTYKTAAGAIGRTHERAVGQMCDLLDAAAALAGVPLLALVRVKSASGQVNPKAWLGEGQSTRLAIIKRSTEHAFTEDDLKGIAAALEQLKDKGLGNRRAWKWVRTQYGKNFIPRLLGASD